VSNFKTAAKDHSAARGGPQGSSDECQTEKAGSSRFFAASAGK
jgi:hypothetical protein